MTRRELKKLVLRSIAAELDGGSIECETEADEARLEKVLDELIDEFYRMIDEFYRRGWEQ